MGLPGYLRGCFPVLPGWGVRCSRSYREGGQRTSLPIGPATAAKPGRAEGYVADHREDRMIPISDDRNRKQRAGRARLAVSVAKSLPVSSLRNTR